MNSAQKSGYPDINAFGHHVPVYGVVGHALICNDITRLERAVLVVHVPVDGFVGFSDNRGAVGRKLSSITE